MKKIDTYLTDYKAKTNPDELIDQLLESTSIRRFVMNHDLKHDTIVSSLNQLLAFKEGESICQSCKGLYECKMSYLGMTPHLSYYQNAINLDYVRCQYNLKDDPKTKIKAYYVPKKIFDADMADFSLIGDARKAIHQHMISFLNNYKPSHPMKGMFLSGIYGAGKTYILAALANELAKKEYKVTFVYYPDLVRELKSSIGSGDLEDRVQELKKAQILFLDDFGGESSSAFIRDEVLGPILQHRVLDELPTFFSSNIKMKSVIQSMAFDGSEWETTKAIRIFERIRTLAVEFELNEKPKLSY